MDAETGMHANGKLTWEAKTGMHADGKLTCKAKAGVHANGKLAWEMEGPEWLCKYAHETKRLHANDYITE